MSEWKTIDSAPKDGSEFLVFDMMHHRKRVVVAHRSLLTGEVLSTPGRYTLNPTHWMPLPAPPSQGQGAGPR